MVELRTRKREMRGYGGNHQEKLGLTRISYASQFAIPDTAGTSPHPACNNINTRSSKPNQASCTPDFSYPLVILHIILIFIPHLSLFLVHNSTVITEHKVKSFTGKNNLTWCITLREAVFGSVIHSIFDAWHYKVLWTCALTRFLWYAWNYVRLILYIMLHSTNLKQHCQMHFFARSQVRSEVHS